MKADKLLFGLTCFGMAYVIHSATNRGSCQETRPQTLLTDSINKNAVSHELAKDTIDFSKIMKNDTVKILQKVAK